MRSRPPQPDSVSRELNGERGPRRSLEALKLSSGRLVRSVKNGLANVNNQTRGKGKPVEKGTKKKDGRGSNGAETQDEVIGESFEKQSLDSKQLNAEEVKTKNKEKGAARVPLPRPGQNLGVGKQEASKAK